MRQEVIDFLLLRYAICLGNSRHFFHPIRRKPKTNRDSLVHVFPPSTSVTCIYFKFYFVYWVVCDWLAWLLWVCFSGTHWKMHYYPWNKDVFRNRKNAYFLWITRPTTVVSFRDFSTLWVFLLLFMTEDSVFMENETDREEYVLADFGYIWVGSARRNEGIPWQFGQVKVSL